MSLFGEAKKKKHSVYSKICVRLQILIKAIKDFCIGCGDISHITRINNKKFCVSLVEIVFALNEVETKNGNK